MVHLSVIVHNISGIRMKLSSLAVFICLLSVFVDAQSLLTRTDSVKLVQATIWGSISYNGENISVTTTAMIGNNPELFLRKLDRNLKSLTSPKQLTFSTDPSTAKKITDHKHLYLNGFHYIAFSVQGDADLYIFRVDKNGDRVETIVPVIENTVFKTNDMFFTTDGTNIHVGYFKPPSQTIIHTFDQNLHQLGSPVTTSNSLPHNNIGGIVFLDDTFYIFTGDIFGKNSNLILTQWNQDWMPAASSPRVLIQSENGDGNWFATGATYDDVNKRWFIGFHHIYAADQNEAEHIDIAVFDRNFSLLERIHATPQKFYRPHFLFLDGYLYMVYDTPGGVFIHKYGVGSATSSPINWKLYFTLALDEGKEWIVDSTAIIPNAGVPGLNITNDNRVILGWGGAPGGRGAGTTNDFGKTFTPLTGIQKPMQIDGGFVYMNDGRTRFVTEEPAPNNTPQKHRSRIVSWISSDGLNWTKESGIRYQPGSEDDSISSVTSVIQVNDTTWRMYYVGDFYRTNGARTAISTDEGWKWRRESNGNILRRGDVDPNPVYLSDGSIRLFHRNGFNSPGPTRSGVAYTDSRDGLTFDTLTTRMIVADSAVGGMLKLDPTVIKYPNGDIACYIGAAPNFGQQVQPKIIAAWAKKTTRVKEEVQPESVVLLQNYPNPFSESTTIRFSLTPSLSLRSGVRRGEFEERVTHHGEVRVSLKVFDLLGREVATLFDRESRKQDNSIEFDASALRSGVYTLVLRVANVSQTRSMVVIH